MQQDDNLDPSNVRMEVVERGSRGRCRSQMKKTTCCKCKGKKRRKRTCSRSRRRRRSRRRCGSRRRKSRRSRSRRSRRSCGSRRRSRRSRRKRAQQILAQNPFIIFYLELLFRNRGKRVVEVAKEAGKRWCSMTEKQRAKYNRLAARVRCKCQGRRR